VAVTVVCPRANVARLHVTGDVVGDEVAGLFLVVQGDAAAFFDDEVSALLLPVEGDVDAKAFFVLLDIAALVALVHDVVDDEVSALLLPVERNVDAASIFVLLDIAALLRDVVDSDIEASASLVMLQAGVIVCTPLRRDSSNVDSALLSSTKSLTRCRRFISSSSSCCESR